MDISEHFSWVFKETDADERTLMSTPYPLLVAALAYLWFVVKSGPEFMKKREPVQFGHVLTLYNGLQVLLSAYLVQTGAHILHQTGFISKTCYFEQEAGIKELIKHNTYVYFLAKLSELIETILFVLRKKQNQVSFLHVWHHLSMVSWSWCVCKYHETEGPVLFATTNSLVHVIMYSYYALTVFPELRKFLWWKKYLTAIQIIQMVTIIVHTIVRHLVSECKPSYFYLGSVCMNGVFFIYLFGNFYVNSYKKSCNAINGTDAKNGRIKNN